VPHIIAEYTESALSKDDVAKLLRTIHQSVTDSGLFEKSHVRTRAYPFCQFTNGLEDKPYVHIQARIKSGRDASNRKALADAILNGVVQLSLSVAVVTVEIIDMDRDSYAKHSVS